LPDSKETAETAKHRILHKPHLTMQRIWCEFDEGRLFLRGQVPSFYFKQLAQEAVIGMDEVRQVINEIEVIWWAVIDLPLILGIFIGSGGRMLPEIRPAHLRMSGAFPFLRRPLLSFNNHRLQQIVLIVKELKRGAARQ
jgi:hypothetical protein